MKSNKLPFAILSVLIKFLIVLSVKSVPSVAAFPPFLPDQNMIILINFNLTPRLSATY